eukprot:jgi/Chlat1/8701/Chrsp88S08069
MLIQAANTIQPLPVDNNIPNELDPSFYPGFEATLQGAIPRVKTAPFHAAQNEMQITSFQGRGSFKHPNWLTVSNISDVTCTKGDSSSVSSRTRNSTAQSELAATTVGSVVPIGGKLGSVLKSFKSSSSRTRDKNLYVEANSLKLRLREEQLPINDLFLDTAVRFLPDNLDNLHEADDSIKRFLAQTGLYFVSSVYLGGKVTGAAEELSNSSRRQRELQTEGRVQMEAAIAEAGFQVHGEHAVDNLQSLDKQNFHTKVEGGNMHMLTHGHSGVVEWLKSLTLPHTPLKRFLHNVDGQMELWPVYKFLFIALEHGKVDKDSDLYQKLLQRYYTLLERWENVTAAVPARSDVLKEDESQRKERNKTVGFWNLSTTDNAILVHVNYGHRMEMAELSVGVGLAGVTATIPVTRRYRELFRSEARLGANQFFSFELPNTSSAVTASCYVLTTDNSIPMFEYVPVGLGRVYNIFH